MRTLLAGTSHIRLPIYIAVLVAVPLAYAAEVTPGSCPEARVQIMEDAHSTAILIPIPAHPLSYALPLGRDGQRQIMVLVVPVDEPSEEAVARDRVRRALASGEFEKIFAGQKKIELRGGRRQIPVEKKGSSDKPYTRAIISALKAAGIDLGIGSTGQPPCPPPVPVSAPALYLLQPHTQPGWAWVQDLPPGTATAIGAMDLDEDGRDELVLESQGRLFQIQAGEDGRFAEPPTLLFADPDLRLRADEPRDVHFPPEPAAIRSPLDDDVRVGALNDRQGPSHADLSGRRDPLHMRVTSLGLLKLYGPEAKDGNWLLQGRITLPTRSIPQDSMLLLAGPEVRTVGRNGLGHLLLAAGPVPYGDQRLLTTIIELDSLTSPRVQEIWSRLPRGEVVKRSGYMILNGEPFLWVQTDEEDEVQLFGDSEALHLFPLTQDPSRAGVLPVLSITKLKNLHQTRLKYGQDVNGDGLDDLVLIGRDDGVLVMGSYLQTREGKFKRSLIRQKLAEDERPSSYGIDLDGDSWPDLVTFMGTEVLIHSGVEPAVKGKKLTLVNPVPTWRAQGRRRSHDAPEQVSCLNPPVFFDLDGDRRSEMMCLGVDGQGGHFFKILTFNPGPEAQAGRSDPAPGATGR